MDDIGRILDEILNEYEAMSPQELDAFLDETLSTPLGQFIQRVNNEIMEAVMTAALDDRECVSTPLYAVETLGRKPGRISSGVAYRSEERMMLPAFSKTQMWSTAPAVDGEYPWAA